MNILAHKWCTLGEGPSKRRENISHEVMKNWATLTALIHQQAVMQR